MWGVTIVSMLSRCFPRFYTANMRFFFDGPELSQLFTYAGITLLACIPYGAFFRSLVCSSAIPSSWLSCCTAGRRSIFCTAAEKISVIQYWLMPVPLSVGPLGVIAEPTSAYLSVPGLLLIVTAIVLIAGGSRIRKMEIKERLSRRFLGAALSNVSLDSRSIV